MLVSVIWDTATRVLALSVLGFWIYVDQLLHKGDMTRVASDLRGFLPLVLLVAVAFSLRVAHRPSRPVASDYRVGSTLGVGCILALASLPVAIVAELIRLDGAGVGILAVRTLWHVAALSLIILAFGFTRRW